MYSDKEILTRLLAVVKEKGMTEKECLEKSGINSSFFSDWKNGRIKSPSLEKVVKIASFLDVSLDQIVNGKENLASIDSDISDFVTNYQNLDDRGKTMVKATLYKELDRVVETQPKDDNRKRA